MERISVVNEERYFDLSELFFSITDRKGIVLTGNEVFSRVSGYTIGELVGQPHNLIRHPDMPRSVFRLFWDTISAGKPIVAYVKNRAKDGKYYWVVANVFILGDRYLSIRIKPSNPLLKTVEKVYADMLDAENKAPAGKEIEAGTAVLTKALAALGIPNYEMLMRDILADELKSRDQNLKQSQSSFSASAATTVTSLTHALNQLHGHCEQMNSVLSRMFEILDQFRGINTNLVKKVDFMLSLSDNIRLFSINASTSAARMGNEGVTLAVIADEIQSNSASSSRQTKHICDQISVASASIRDSVYHVASAKLQIEMIRFFAEEILRNPHSAEDHLDLFLQNKKDLLHVFDLSIRSAFSSLKALADQLHNLSSSTRQIEHLGRAIHIIRSIGNIELASITDAGAFQDLFGRFEDLAAQAIRESNELQDGLASIRRKSLEMTKQEKTILDSIKKMEASTDTVSVSDRTPAIPAKTEDSGSFSMRSFSESSVEAHPVNQPGLWDKIVNGFKTLIHLH